MKFGVFGLLFSPRITRAELSIFEKASRFGYEGVEISLSEDFLSMGITKDVLEAAKNNGMSCICSTSLNEETNITSKDRDVREKGIDFLKRCVAASAELESDVLGGVIYAPWGFLNEGHQHLKSGNFVKRASFMLPSMQKSAMFFLLLNQSTGLSRTF